ncbi:ligand-binding sensor domain-containing protein [Flavisolibacter ginsenosidimutans]|nr:two-component regulator propeller domain-containing protein [Flavisolibacter ginsenosidimutans]
MNSTAKALLLSLSLFSKAKAQNVFPQKVEGCNTSQFCLDCGEVQATYDADAFKDISNKINAKYNFKNGKGSVAFQVLVDSFGKGCVISHTDAMNSQISKDLIVLLNGCKWLPAKDANKATSSSINVVFEVSNGQLAGYIQRVDTKAMSENMSNPGTPEIFNKHYKYKNVSLPLYEITVLQKESSSLPNNMSIHSVVDKNDIVWYGTYNGIVRFDGNKIIRLDKSNSPFEKEESISAIAVDNENNKWISSNNSIYKFNNGNWTKVDSTKTGSGWTRNIVAVENGEVLFCTNKGLVIYHNDQWSLLNQKRVKQLPSNEILYAYKDKKQRLWVGTYKGSIMIDVNNRITEFNQSKTPLNQICISKAVEDSDGNIYFGLYDYERSPVRDRPRAGIAVFRKDGTWIHYNDTNSGLPANTINSVLFDKFENVLWIGTNDAGLVRFDLKDMWENYHNLNSKVPSSYTFDLSQDSKGNIYASTFNGMMRLRKK